MSSSLEGRSSRSFPVAMASADLITAYLSSASSVSRQLLERGSWTVFCSLSEFNLFSDCFWSWDLRFVTMARATAMRSLHSLLPPPASSLCTSGVGRGLLVNGFSNDTESPWGVWKHALFPGRSVSTKADTSTDQKGKKESTRPPIAVVRASSSLHFERLMKDAKANKGGLAVVYFMSRSSDACRLMTRAANFLSTQYHDITFLLVDFDKPAGFSLLYTYFDPQPELQGAIDTAGITDVPTFQVYKKGKVIAEMNGDSPTKLKEMVAGSRFYAKYRKK